MLSWGADIVVAHHPHTVQGYEKFGKKIFDYPKPSSLIKYLISFIDDHNFTVLDFFSGSGTTADAVMQLNSEDGGKRNFILVQNLRLP